MQSMKLKHRDIGLQCLLFILILAQPLMSLTRNPDILHDAFFFSQGKAVNLGLKVHTDIYSPYGPLVPWIFSATMKIFGDYLIIGRILGFLLQFGSCMFMFFILRRKLSQSTSMLCVGVFVSLSPERTEVTSTRWIYGAGIWPTSVTILLTLNLIWIAIQVFETKQNDNVGYAKLFLASLPAPFLLVSRLQGILVFLFFLFLILFFCIKGEKRVRLNSLIVLFGMVISGTVLIFQMIKSEVFVDTFNEMIIGPFNVTDYAMEGRWLSWFTSMLISLISSLLCFFILTILLKFLISRFDVKVVTLGSSIFTFITFMYASFFEFPVAFNGNLLLWGIKVTTWIPSWIPWAVATLSIYIILRISFNWLKVALLDIKKATNFANGNVFLILMGTASFSNLFWNYSYVYALLPITFILVVFNLELLSFRPDLKKALRVIALSQVIVFFFVSLTGFLQKSQGYSSEILAGMRDTRKYSSEIDSVVNYVSSIRIQKSSQYYCNYPIFRYFDVESYKIDRELIMAPPKSKVDYLSSIRNSAKQILVCDERNFFNASELDATGWTESVQKRIEDNPSLSIQLLRRGGGG